MKSGEFEAKDQSGTICEPEVAFISDDSPQKWGSPKLTYRPLEYVRLMSVIMVGMIRI